MASRTRSESDADLAQSSIHFALAASAEDKDVENLEDAERIDEQKHDEPSGAPVRARAIQGEAFPDERPDDEC